MSTTGRVAPVQFADAEQINPYQVLLDLHDHRMAHVGHRDRGAALADLALAAAVVSWWTRWQPGLIHAALRTGADVADIAAATGLDPGAVVRRWRTWAEVQTRLLIGGRPALDPAEVRAVADRVGREVGVWT